MFMVVYGALLWALVFFVMWASNRARKAQERAEVSRNGQPFARPLDPAKTGPAWEQDEPYIEAFEEADDDL
jgi:hypothetical protein